MLQSPRLKDHVQTIGIDQSLRNNALYKYKFLENIKNYTNMLVSVTTSNNSKILSRLLWFLLLKDSPMTVPYLPWNQHQSRNQVLENHCVFSLTFEMWRGKLLPVELELKNLSISQLNTELHHGHWKKPKRGFKNEWPDK